MKPPCEIVVKYLLPMIRAMIAEELADNYGLKQEESAKRLGVTQSAISYYLSKSRGAANLRNYPATILEDNPDIRKAVKEIAEAVAKGKVATRDTVKKFCETCRALRSGQAVCRMHVSAVPSIGENCDLCLASRNRATGIG